MDRTAATGSCAEPWAEDRSPRGTFPTSGELRPDLELGEKNAGAHVTMDSRGRGWLHHAWILVSADAVPYDVLHVEFVLFDGPDVISRSGSGQKQRRRWESDRRHRVQCRIRDEVLSWPETAERFSRD